MRKTKVSVAVQSLFETSSKPVSVLDIQIHLQQQGLRPNKTTLYRMLEKLCTQGVTKKISLKDEMAHYEKVSDPHAHFVCTKCDDINCLPSFNPEQILSKIGINPKNVTVTSTHLALKGLCSNCS